VGCCNQTGSKYQGIPCYKGDKRSYEQASAGKYQPKNDGVEKKWADYVEPTDDIVRD
jgi:hypothetical protein